MSTPLPLVWMWASFYIAVTVVVNGQTPASSSGQQAATSSGSVSASPIRTTIQQFQEQQMNLANQESELEAQGANPQQLQAWQQQNASLFALQQQRAQAISIASALHLQSTNRQPRIPANASHALRDFLTAQSTLANARAALHNQLVLAAKASGQSLSLAQVASVGRQEDHLFRQQNADLLSLQARRSQALAAAGEQTAIRVPGPTRIAPNTSPQMASFLTNRDQLRRQMMQLRNEYVGATPAVRAAAMQTWMQQNAAQIRALQQQAQSLSQAASTTTN